MYHDRIDISERIDPTKSNRSKECVICHYWSFNHGFKFQDSVWNGCHDLTILSLNISDIAIITVKHVDYRFFIHKIRKSEAINLLKIYQVYNYNFDNFVKAKKLETKNILINKKNYKDLTIYFTSYVHSKEIKMLIVNS